MSKIGKSISSLLTFAIFGAWFTFVIWGIKTWGTANPFVSERTTVILLSLLTFIAFFILFVIGMAIGASAGKEKKKEEEKKFEFTTKDGEKIEFKKGEDFSWMPAAFKEMGKKFGKKKEEEKKFGFTTKDGEKIEFKAGDDLDWIPDPFKEMAKKFIEMAKKEMDKEKEKKK